MRGSEQISDPEHFAGARAFYARAASRGARVVVAWSGGADSSFVLEALRAAPVQAGTFELIAAHVQHGLRGAAAEADLEHCQRRARELGLRLEVARLAPPSGAGETWARHARYEALERIALGVGAQAVLTGHHLEDQVETLLWQLLRGVRPSRARGMRIVRPLRAGSPLALIRPALALPRARMASWLAQRGIPHVVDESNLDPRLSPRNALRHRVIPLLDQIAPAGWQARWVRFFTRDARAARVQERNVETGLFALLLQSAGLAPTSKRREALRRALTQGQATTLLGTRFGVRIVRRGERIEVVHGACPAPQFDRTLAVDGGVDAPPGILHLDSVSASEAERHIHHPDRVLLLLPRATTLSWRNARPTEQIWPSGAPKPRRLRGLLAGRGWDAARRAHASVLACDDAVAWLIGVEIDRRYAWKAGQIVGADQQLVCARFEARPAST